MKLLLEITYRHGRPLVAYLYLPRRPGEKSYRTAKATSGLLIDYSRREKPIGIEITVPMRVTAAAVNRVLRKIGLPPVNRSDLAPLRAA